MTTSGSPPQSARVATRRRTASACAVMLALLLGGCGEPRLSFESHLMHDHGDEHGMPSLRHSVDIKPGDGEIRIAGRVPVGLCPAVRGEVERSARRLLLHVDIRPPNRSRGERCESPHPVAMAEYTATITGLRPAEYVVVVHHEALSITRDRYDTTRTRTRYSTAEVAQTTVRVR